MKKTRRKRMADVSDSFVHRTRSRKKRTHAQNEGGVSDQALSTVSTKTRTDDEPVLKKLLKKKQSKTKHIVYHTAPANVAADLSPKKKKCKKSRNVREDDSAALSQNAKQKEGSMQTGFEIAKASCAPVLVGDPVSQSSKKQRGPAKPAEKAAMQEKERTLGLLDVVLSKTTDARDDQDASDSDAERQGLKVFVGGLSWKVDAATVRKDFEDDCGEIAKFDMPLKEGSPMGIAFICFKTQEGVQNALAFDGDLYHDRVLNVKISDPTQAVRRATWNGSWQTAGHYKRSKDYGASKGRRPKARMNGRV